MNSPRCPALHREEGGAPWLPSEPVQRQDRSMMQKLFADRPDVFAPVSLMPADELFAGWNTDGERRERGL
jgi:hypothetical protein